MIGRTRTRARALPAFARLHCRDNRPRRCIRSGAQRSPRASIQLYHPQVSLPRTEKTSPPAISVEFRTKFYENNRKLQIKLHLKLRRDRRVVCTASGSSGVPARVHAMAAERSLAAERCRLLEEYRDGSRAMAASSSPMPHTTASTPLKTRSGASSFSGTAMRKRLRSSSAQHAPACSRRATTLMSTAIERAARALRSAIELGWRSFLSSAVAVLNSSFKTAIKNLSLRFFRP